MNTRFDWKRLSWLDWFLAVPVAAGMMVYGIWCIVERHGVLMFPSHRIEHGAPAPGLTVTGDDAVRAGITWLVWAVFCHFAAIGKAWTALDRETWGKCGMALFAAAVVSTLWTLFSMK